MVCQRLTAKVEKYKKRACGKAGPYSRQREQVLERSALGRLVVHILLFGLRRGFLLLTAFLGIFLLSGTNLQAGESGELNRLVEQSGMIVLGKSKALFCKN